MQERSHKLDFNFFFFFFLHDQKYRHVAAGNAATCRWGIWQCLGSLHVYLPSDPVNPCLGIYPKDKVAKIQNDYAKGWKQAWGWMRSSGDAHTLISGTHEYTALHGRRGSTDVIKGKRLKSGNLSRWIQGNHESLKVEVGGWRVGQRDEKEGGGKSQSLRGLDLPRLLWRWRKATPSHRPWWPPGARNDHGWQQSMGTSVLQPQGLNSAATWMSLEADSSPELPEETWPCSLPDFIQWDPCWTSDLQN